MAETPWIHNEVTRVVKNDDSIYATARRCKRLLGIKKGAERFHHLYGERLSIMIGLTISKTACITVMRNV